ncbi:hypothetical protein [Halomonas caseinilytica]|uniref:Uncharacterized protein n=1 Tax=Halomonas caseinilytica TaxID=438744 RepID=A0A1M6TAA5_9GAMM|nr:hypothetical protein [Halomonas caseinilytica]SHK53891.1 hypothetical protein SAMN05192556_103268 [Halomonas caseinilytica]
MNTQNGGRYVVRDGEPVRVEYTEDALPTSAQLTPDDAVEQEAPAEPSDEQEEVDDADA